MLGSVGLVAGSLFYLAFVYWLAAAGTFAEVLTTPLTEATRPFTATFYGIGLSFLVIWFALVGERLRLAAQHERDLESINRRLRQQSEELEEYAYAISHDLRSPLVAVDWLLDEVQDLAEPDPEAAKAAIVRAHELVAQMNQLVDDLLALARLEREARTDARSGVQTVTEQALASVAPAVRQRRARIDTTGLTTAQAFVPPARLRQVVQNLVSNAVEHGRHGGTVRLACFEKEEGVLRLEVADDGPGVPEDERERIFHAFARGSTRSENGSGSGIGLALVRKIAQTYGGQAWVEPAGDAGARFCVELPGAVSSSGAAAE